MVLILLYFIASIDGEVGRFVPLVMVLSERVCYKCLVFFKY
jgi:hypothetical protein